MRPISNIVAGNFLGADIEPGTFHRIGDRANRRCNPPTCDCVGGARPTGTDAARDHEARRPTPVNAASVSAPGYEREVPVPRG